MNFVDEEYKLDTPAVVSHNADEYEMVEIRSDNLLVTNDPVFRMSLKDTSTYTNPHKGYLQVTFSVVKAADGSAYSAAENITLKNSIGCLFSRAQLRLQNQIVETVDEQHLCSHIKNIMLYSQDYQVSSATNELYYKQTGTALAADPAEFTTTPNEGFTSRNAAFNSGFKSAKDRTNNSTVVTCIIPLSHVFSFCGIDRVMTGNQLDVELTRSNASDHLFRDSGAADGKVAMSSISMWLPRIRPTAELDMNLKSMLSAGVTSDYVFPAYNGYLTTALPLNAGSTNNRIATLSEKVLHAFVMLRKGGQAQTDSAHLTRDEINELSCRLNGRVYPSRRYDNLATPEGKARGYLELVRQASKSFSYADGIQLSLEDFSAQSVYGFDFSAQDENWSKCPSTVEVVANLAASNGGAARAFAVVLVTEKQIQVSYMGGSPTINVV